jgi:ribosomal protein S18 acetylase RimI-like enzyme
MMITELIPQTSANDRDRFVPAYLDIWNHPDNLGFLSFTGQRFEEKQVQDWCSRHLKDGVRYFGSLGEEWEVNGLLVTRAIPFGGFELFSIGILPESKRLGIGRTLVRHGLEFARTDGYPAVEARVFATNAPMLCLLLNEGFAPVDMEHRKGPLGEDLVHLKRYF